MKNIITVTGIRPDFIRMSEIFKKLDQNFNHTLIHTGQHYDKLLSDIFFEELEIRKPDYNLNIGGANKEHFHQTSDLSIKLIELIRSERLTPDLIIFLGDSNSVVSSIALKKEGYKIGHIEAGMRSGDKRMLEEINRMVCDVCSDFLFVYHENYKEKLAKENIINGVYVVGNTIVEVVNKFKPTGQKRRDKILLDIHRPENFLHKNRLINILGFATTVSQGQPIEILGFKRTLKAFKDFDLYPEYHGFKIIELLPFKKYLDEVYHASFIISDSGTAQEEPALLNTPVIVPRDFTERPESVENHSSFMIDVNNNINSSWKGAIKYLAMDSYRNSSTWLGDGSTSDRIISILKGVL